MMPDAIKLLSNTISFTAANTVFNAGTLVVYTTATTLITQKNANNVTVGSIILDKGSYVFRKTRTDTFEANVAISCSSIAN